MSQIPEQQFANNIEDARDAALLIEMAGEQRPRFWEKLIEMAQDQLPPKPVPVDPCPPMDDKEAANFERLVMPYGKYGGDAIGDLPVSYLLWLTEGDEVVKNARRYVRSKRFQERQDTEGGEDE